MTMRWLDFAAGAAMHRVEDDIAWIFESLRVVAVDAGEDSIRLEELWQQTHCDGHGNDVILWAELP